MNEPPSFLAPDASGSNTASQVTISHSNNPAKSTFATDLPGDEHPNDASPLDGTTRPITFQDRARGVWANCTLSEFSGSLGDLGTLLPILVSLSIKGQISLRASLIFGGLYNIITGLMFGIPMCVQPMKAIAAVALTSNMPQNQIVTAGFSVSAIILVLGITGTLRVLNLVIPLPIVRGIQFGTGLTLISNGVLTIQKSDAWQFAGHAWLDNYFVAILAFLVVLLSWNGRKNPSAVILFAVGIIISAIKIWGLHLGGKTMPDPTPAFGFPRPVVPSGDDFKEGFLNAGLGQLPLTALNSVIAVSQLANDLFPKMPRPVASVTRVSIGVGLMNIVGMWFGSMPFCHGSGGLAAQYRFGARTGVSMYLLGFLKLLLGLIFGSTLLALFSLIPNSILGVMLVAAGVEIILITRDLGTRDTTARIGGGRGGYQVYDGRRGIVDDNFAIMVLTGCGTSFWKNDGVGFCIGLVASIALWVARCAGAGDQEVVGARTWYQGAYGAARRDVASKWVEIRGGEKVARGEMPKGQEAYREDTRLSSIAV